MHADGVNPWRAPDPTGNKGGEATLEQPGAAVNVVWQTRAAPPSAHERALADALRASFADDVHDLPGIVARLNAAGLKTISGATWTEAVLVAELARLGR
jgi:hypothetical protein